MKNIVMKSCQFIIFLAAFFLISCITKAQNNDSSYDKLVSLVNELWKTESAFKSKRTIKNICKLNPDYNTVVKILRERINYPSNTKTGFVEWNYKLDSLDYFCALYVPNNYNSNKKYSVSFILHGAAMSFNPQMVKSYVTPEMYNLDSLDRIVIYPASWIQSPWWNEKQIRNLNYIIQKLKRSYNIDENNINLTGISDGGTGIIYQANFNITPWANFKPYISDPASIAESDTPVFLKNLRNRSFLFISSEKDPLFPPERIESFLSEMEKVNNPFQYYSALGYKHEISWLPIYKDTIAKFDRENCRDPYPSKLVWQANNTDYGRNHWVVIDKLKNNEQVDNKKYPIIEVDNYVDNKVSRVIDVLCEDNIINVKSVNVKQFTLLLSPDQFNFEEEIQIITNNELSYKGKVTKDLNTLLIWYSKDLDRTMLFGAELTIKN